MNSKRFENCPENETASPHVPQRILVSACLLGHPVRYNGVSVECDQNDKGGRSRLCHA
jgi:hypothetical protein